MATVSSFESLRFPSRADLGQFAELFEPLYAASTEDARRQAVAALSRCPQVPERTALFIGTQPVGIAAIFLTVSRAVSDRTLLAVLDATGPEHARAIAGREALSPAVVEALVGRHQDHASRQTGAEREDARQDAERTAREEAVRDELRALVRAMGPVRDVAPAPLAPASELHRALLVRFARAGETGMLAVALADALGASQWLSERILLDLSGQQLAETLLALGLDRADSRFVLSKVYPHMTAGAAGALVAALDPESAAERVRSWQRADRYTNGGDLPEAANGDGAPATDARRGRAAG